MPDEQEEEALRVYHNEGKALKPNSDLVNEDKVDLHCIADDISEQQPQGLAPNDENSTAAKDSNGVETPITTAAAAPSSATASSGSHPLRSGFCSSERRYRTAFSNFSPTYASQAQILQQIATQQYYGYLTANARLYQHFVNSHPSSPLGSPNYLNPQWTPTGVLSMPPGLSPVTGVPSHTHHHHWAAAASSSSSSPFGTLDPATQKAAAAAACFGFAPWLVAPNVHHHAAVAAAAAQLSPSFLLPVDQISHPGMSAVPFMNFNSPLPSPDFGVPLAPLGTKVGLSQPPHVPFSSLKLSMPVPPSQFIPRHYGEQTAGQVINHLDAIRQIVPSKANSNCTIGHHGMTNQTLIKQENGQCVKDFQQNACCSTSNPSISIVNNRQLNCQRQLKESRKHHIKKPLNAFMLYMKQMRQTVMQEADLRERQSAEINKILGKRWHALTKEEQQKYFDMAKKERMDHLKKYPNWSARDNYAIHKKKKKRKDKTHDNSEAKKCRARFGLNQQDQWCKHCKRKKKCLWFKEADSGPESIDTSPPAQVSSTSHGEDESSSNIHHHNQLLNNGHCFPPNTSSNIETAKYLATLNNIKTENVQNHNEYFGNDSESINNSNKATVNRCATVVATTGPLLLTHVLSSNCETSATKTSSSSTVDEDLPMIIDGDSADDEGEDFSSDSDSSSMDEEDEDEENDLRVTVSSSDDEKMTVSQVALPRN